MGCVEFVELLRAEQRHIRVIPQTPELFAEAFALYTARSDKSWSLADCASMALCQQEAITEVLTYDHHFVQAGFTALLRENI